MANCTSCGRELPAFSTGPLSTLCRDCQARENSPSPIPSVSPSEKRSPAISLNPDGWQQERYPINDFYTLPLETVKDAEGQDLKVSVKLPTGKVFIQIWKLGVGRITVYLLDTNIPDNVLPQDRDITDSLYGGDIDTRIRQEIVLGIGGMLALDAMGLKQIGR